MAGREAGKPGFQSFLGADLDFYQKEWQVGWTLATLLRASVAQAWAPPVSRSGGGQHGRGSRPQALSWARLGAAPEPSLMRAPLGRGSGEADHPLAERGPPGSVSRLGWG